MNRKKRVFGLAVLILSIVAVMGLLANLPSTGLTTTTGRTVITGGVIGTTETQTTTQTPQKEEPTIIQEQKTERITETTTETIKTKALTAEEQYTKALELADHISTMIGRPVTPQTTIATLLPIDNYLQAAGIKGTMTVQEVSGITELKNVLISALQH